MSHRVLKQMFRALVLRCDEGLTLEVFQRNDYVDLSHQRGTSTIMLRSAMFMFPW